MQEISFLLNDYLKEHIALFTKLEQNFKNIEQISKILMDTIKQGNKVLIMGNGGSAADAQHFAAELVGRYKIERKAFPAIALTTDSSILTCVPNDFSFDKVFERQIEALAEQGDLVIGLSTSGNSKNVFNALKTAKEKGCFTAALLGNQGGKIKELSDLSVIVDSSDTARIQEAHIFMIHCICEITELRICNEPS